MGSEPRPDPRRFNALALGNLEHQWRSGRALPGLHDEVPDLWWPGSRAWFVASDTDLDHCTDVGGSRELIDGVLADARLDAAPVGPSDPLVRAERPGPESDADRGWQGGGMVRLFDGEVDVAYSQFYVETPEVIPGGDVSRRFAGQVNGLCGAGEPGMLQCTTGLHTGRVPVAVDLLEAAPDEIADGWEEVVEVSLTSATAHVLLYDWDHQQPVELPLGPGGFRVRYHATGMQAGHDADTRGPGEPVLDRYLLQVWPTAPDAEPAADALLRQTSDLADYWHDTARSTTAPDTQGLTQKTEKLSDEERLAAFHQLIQDVAMSSPELQRAIAAWLAHRTARIVGPAATTWAQPALDALDHGRPLPAPFDDRQAALTAAQRDLATTEDPQELPGDRTAGAAVPRGTTVLLTVVMHAGDPDPQKAVMGALTVAQHVNHRPETELHGELRARFLPAAQDFLGLTEAHAHTLARDRLWVVRDKTPGGFYTDEYHPERINVWLDDHGVITHAEIG